MAVKRTPIKERFETKYKVNKKTGCWEWTASLDENGYGQISEGGIEGTVLRAHRVSFELYNSPIPESTCVLHRCDNPKCVNPEHLFLGTQMDNSNDKIDKGRDVQAIGTEIGTAKLTERDVLEIRAKYIPLVYTYKMIAEEYGISPQQVQAIVLRKYWTHI